MKLIDWIWDIPYYSKIVFNFCKETPAKVTDWVGNTYSWLGDAFTNWDSQMEDFWNQIVFMANKTVWALKMIIEKGTWVLSEFKKLIGEILKGFDGFL